MSGSTLRKTFSRKTRVFLLCAVISSLIVLGSGFALRARRDREKIRSALANGQDLLRRGHPARALEAVAQVPERGFWEPDLLTIKGLAFAALDRPEAVRPLLERSMKIDPNQPMAAKVLAAVYFATNEIDRGFAMLERSARLEPDDFRPWFATGDMVLKFHLPPSDAVRAFNQSLRLRPDHLESKVGLIDALLSKGSTAEATPLLEAGLREHPDDPRFLRLAARHAQLSGQLEEMNHFAEQALHNDPNNVEARVLHTQYLYRVKRLTEALSQAEETVEVAPNDLSALNLLSQIEGSLGMKDRSAVTALRRRESQHRGEQMSKLMDEMKKRPEDPEPRWRMGQVAAKGGLVSLAMGSYRAALALDPQCKPALDGLAGLKSSTTAR